jgi:hypothetical protein
MNRKMLDALENCLLRMKLGDSLEAALSMYPHLAAQLRPLLETAALARPAVRENLPLTVLARQRARGMALAAGLRQESNRRSIFRNTWRPALTVLSVIAILVMSSNGLFTASAQSLPGDTLYPLKRSVESTQLKLVSDPVKHQDLEREFDERRVEEARELITDKRVEGVEFTGLVSSQSENEWLVSGIHVVITSQTKMEAVILVGDMIEVHGATNASGGVDASLLTLVEKGADQENHPEVSPISTPSPESTGESGLHENPSESSVTPSHSGEGDDQSDDGNVSSPDATHESHSSEENSQTPQPDSGGEED